jgi:hypothetical protein
MRGLTVVLAVCIFSTVCKSQSSPNIPPQIPPAVWRTKKYLTESAGEFIVDLTET